MKKIHDFRHFDNFFTNQIVDSESNELFHVHVSQKMTKFYL